MKLGDICDINMGQSPSSETYNTNNSGIPFFQGNADFGERSPIVRIYCSKPTKIAKKGDILFSVRAPIGAINIADCECCIGRGLSALTPKKSTTEYLFFLLKAKNKILQSLGTGSTFKAINKNTLLSLPISSHSINEQRIISNKLSLIENAIRIRERQLVKLNQLAKSRFIEMFGDFPLNEKKWETGQIRNVVYDVRYGTSLPASLDGKYPYFRMNNITYSGELDLSEIKRINIPDREFSKYAIQKGDVLFNRTNSKELVGKTCVYDKDDKMILAGFIIRIRVNDRMLPEFLSAFLNADFSKKMLLEKCKTAIGQANINAQELQNFDIYIPPIELQKQFVFIKNQLDKSKFRIKKSLEKLEMTYKALLQEYFG